MEAAFRKQSGGVSETQWSPGDSGFDPMKLAAPAGGSWFDEGLVGDPIEGPDL